MQQFSFTLGEIAAHLKIELRGDALGKNKWISNARIGWPG